MKAKHLCKSGHVGALVPGLTGKGVVAAVHSSAVYIRRPDGLLVAIVEKFSHMTSLSFTAPDLFQNGRHFRPSILPGDAVTLGKDVLFLGGLSFDLRRGKGWSGILNATQFRLWLLPKLFLLKEILLEVGKEDGLLGLVGGRKDPNPFVRRALAALRASASEGGARSSLQKLFLLIGLGPGFTPSGDDFITGALAAERLSRNLGRPPAFIDKGELRNSLHKTSDAGRTLLWQALQGRFPCYVLEALKSIAKAGDSRELTQALSRVVAHGETSGTDLLTGLIWYLERVARS